MQSARYVGLQIVMVRDGFTAEVNSGFKRNSTGRNRIRYTDWDCLQASPLCDTVGGNRGTRCYFQENCLVVLFKKQTNKKTISAANLQNQNLI